MSYGRRKGKLEEHISLFPLGIVCTVTLMATVLRGLSSQQNWRNDIPFDGCPLNRNHCASEKDISYTWSGRSKHSKMSTGGFCEDFLKQSLEIIVEPTLISIVL